MMFVSVPVYLAVLFGSSLVAAYFLWIFYNKKMRKAGSRIRPRPATTAGGVRRRIGNAALSRRLAARMHADSDSDEPAQRNDISDANNPGEQTSDLLETQSKELTKKKIGAKKAAKLAEKERRKEEREAEQRYREHQRKIEDQEIEKRKRAEEAEEKAAAEAVAAEAKRLEEEAAREKAEYELLKQEFSIEEEGVDSLQNDGKMEAQLNAQLIQSVQEAKIITVEHLAVNLNLKTEVCVEKLKALISSGNLTGVLDDRGKFIYITNEEYEAVAEFIEKRGRVTLSELIENGHKLIRTNPILNS